jgi:hypothetical protein
MAVHPLCMQAGPDQSTRCAACRTLYPLRVEPSLLNEIRHTENHELVPGSGEFKYQIVAMLNRRTEEKPGGRPRKECCIREYQD